MKHSDSAFARQIMESSQGQDDENIHFLRRNKSDTWKHFGFPWKKKKERVEETEHLEAMNLVGHVTWQPADLFSLLQHEQLCFNNFIMGKYASRLKFNCGVVLLDAVT